MTDNTRRGVLGGGSEPGPLGTPQGSGDPTAPSPGADPLPSPASQSPGPGHGASHSGGEGQILGAGAAPAAASPFDPPASREERIRRELADIRRTLRGLVGRLPPDAAIFHSGSHPEELRAFKAFLAARGFPEAITLEETSAGTYLLSKASRIRELIYAAGPDDTVNGYDVRTFTRPEGGEFSVSLMGIWRELSARFAAEASGIVHVLLAEDRTRLPERGQMFWHYRQGRDGASLDQQLLEQLRVFGFVEHPILQGSLFRNQGVTAIVQYVRAGAEGFREVRRTLPGEPL